ncbi:MAG: phosphoglucosamine mutase [bacterium]|nr:phosphoglucosamine mutase [bacterium]
MKQIKSIKLGISGVRGIIGESLEPGHVVNLTRAFATLMETGKIAVAQDSRLSGDMIKRAVFSGLIFSGCTPVDTFMLPTPSLEIFVKERKLKGGIIITASHNPDEWNGLKFVDEKGLFISPFVALNLIDIYHQRSFRMPEENRFPDVEVERDAFSIHRRKILEILDVKRIRKRRFKVLADPGGGVGSSFDKPFLEALGCDVVMINDQMGKQFPREPEPTVRNLEDTSACMERGEFDIGFAQDPDGDRLSILDETGKPIGGELTLAMAIYGYLSRMNRSGGKVVVNLSTSRVMEDVAGMFGFEVLRSPVGEINVTEMMMKENAVAGGEGNGGIIIPEVHRCRDSFTGMALVLDAMAASGKTVSDIVGQFPVYKIVKRKIPISMSAAHKVISLLKESYRDGNTLDGLRVDTGEYWFHVRPSNTEPVMRIVAEGSEEKIDGVMDGLVKRIKRMKDGK